MSDENRVDVKIMNAEGILFVAEQKARELLEAQDDRTKEKMLDTLDEYFNRGIDKKKFIDVNRIPLICQDIANIHQSIAKLEDNTTWIVRLIIGAIVLALLGLVLVQ